MLRNAVDGSSKKVVKETEKNKAGNEVAVTITTNTDAKGTVIGVTETSKIKDAAKNTSVTVVVKEDGKGKVTSASATVENVSTNGKVTLLANVVSRISLTLKCMRFAHHKEIRI